MQPLKAYVNTLILVVFRSGMWMGLFVAVNALLRGRSQDDRAARAWLQRVSGLYVATLIAYLLPYQAGFLYQRHLCVLFFPVFAYLSLPGLFGRVCEPFTDREAEDVGEGCVLR